MKIIFTKTFLSDFRKDFSNIHLEVLAQKIRQKFQTQPFYLKRPYVKLKFTIHNTAIRFVGKYEENQLIMLPIFVFKKTNKLKWENIVWESVKNDILKAISKIDRDLQNGDYEVYK